MKKFVKFELSIYGPKFTEIGEDMPRTNTLIMPNFITVGQRVYEKKRYQKSVTPK